MDQLSDVLRVVRLSGAFFYRVEAASPWLVETGLARDVTPHVIPQAEHLISYHILTSGHCVGGLLGEPPLELVAGDAIVFPHGDPHRMSSAPGVRVPPVDGTAPARYLETVLLGQDPGAIDATFVCGFLGCDRRPFNPLLESLPRQIHVRGLEKGWLSVFADQVVRESRQESPGAECVLTRLAELMFIEVLRHYISTLPPTETGWLAGLADPVVSGALARIHADPARPWTLEGLAAEVAISRTRLAERFTRVVGLPPMQYLAKWRMQVAAGLLERGGSKVATVASAVGYDSEAAFSRAFSKATGASPGAWRRRARA